MVVPLDRQVLCLASSVPQRFRFLFILDARRTNIVMKDVEINSSFILFSCVSFEVELIVCVIFIC